MNAEMQPYLQPGATVDSDHASIIAFSAANAGESSDPRQRAVNLYYAVRDGIRYNPYALEITIEGLRASSTLRVGQGWCVAKAILLAAACRAAWVPARLGFADVRNHLTTERMRTTMQTDIFYWHGYTSIYLDGAWVKATPAFNIELCERFRIRPLEFDGRGDSIYHPLDLDGNRHMEYLNYRGEFADVPLERIIATFSREYTFDPSMRDADFAREVERENPPETMD